MTRPQREGTMARHRNGGLRKRCGCPRARWAKCPHGWHFSFQWRGRRYRVSLDTETGRHIDSKTEAEEAADRLRQAIRRGTFQPGADQPQTTGALSFRAFADLWLARRGRELVAFKDHTHRLTTVCAFPLPGSGLTFGAKPMATITTDDIEAFRDHRKGKGLSAVTVNHDLKLLRMMFAWGVRKGYRDRTPFKVGTEPAITLEREVPRDRRFQSDDDEQRLLKAARPHLRAVIVAMLDTCCRPGEILSLQWRDVNLERRELIIRAVKEKTRRTRLIPISGRLLAVLEMRRTDPAGQPLPLDAYAFGTRLGQQVKNVAKAWKKACAEAKLHDFQLRDLRHEAGSRFDEAGVPLNYVSKMLGHSDLMTTSLYLNIHRRGLQRAMKTYETHRSTQEKVAQTWHTAPDGPRAAVHPTSALDPKKSQPVNK